MKILWHSVAPWTGSGYGQQTAVFAPRLAEDLGHDVAISAYYGLQGAPTMWNGLRVYPAYHAGYGTDIVVTHALDHYDVHDVTFGEAAASGLIILLGDAWTFQAPLLERMAVAAWVPVDHVTMPGPTLEWFAQYGAVPVAMSRHGERLMNQADMECLYVPHGIDLTVFKPGDREVARDRLGIPNDAFVVAMVAANIGRDGSRKAFAEQIMAFDRLRAAHSDAVLYLHTDVRNSQGVDVHRMLTEWLPKGSWRYVDQYAYRRGAIGPADVADVYRAADLLTNCSWGEGFGIPIVEAQACGTPVVVTNATSMPELVGAGWAVGYEPLWHESQWSWACLPRMGEIAGAYIEAYDKAGSMREQAAAFAQMYGADFVTQEYWKPTLERLDQARQARMDEARNPKTSPGDWPKVRTVDGLLWYDRGPGSEDLIGPSQHEHELEPIIMGLVDENSVVVDIGAHVGHWTLRLAQKVAKVHAIEANPEAASVLRRNVALNDLDNKITVHEVAVWDEPTELRLEDPNNHTGGGSTRTLPVYASENGEILPGTVPAWPLDLLSPADNPIDLIKLDIEGADLHALRGMHNTLDWYQPTLFIECHDYAGYYTRAELEQTLEDLGYTWRVAHRYMSTWSPDGELEEAVPADYLVATPVACETCAVVGRDAVENYGASQHSDELAMLLHRLDRDDYEVLIEIGCDVGGTLWAWQHYVPHVIGITLADNSYATGGTGGPLQAHGAKIFVGDSHNPDVLRRVASYLTTTLKHPGIDVLVLDGDHSEGGIAQDLADYGPLVRPGGMILLHDIATVGDPRAEVHKVWPDLRDRYDTEEILSPAFPFGWGIIKVREGDTFGAADADSDPG